MIYPNQLLLDPQKQPSQHMTSDLSKQQPGQQGIITSLNGRIILTRSITLSL
ncbi:nuclear distribution protein RO10 [Histoplasma capsulatum var. duboisii H88]|uniref:Nuclear distribution protein RO10 n=1 Tax=Ajellomyces capsulatus (strain H88) TaxID=544711 RepID=A0A8A1LHU7_AJEC8|nr:nuclear distribution protein RO10 [Histoplasma capsulatum var. duboisii H88]